MELDYKERALNAKGKSLCLEARKRVTGVSWASR